MMTTDKIIIFIISKKIILPTSLTILFYSVIFYSGEVSLPVPYSSRCFIKSTADWIRLMIAVTRRTVERRFSSSLFFLSIGITSFLIILLYTIRT